MTATHAIDPTTSSTPLLYLAFELGWNSWKLASTIGAGQKPRIRSIPARDTNAVMNEIRDAKRRFRLPETAPVMTCYEAGRDGFWLHRFLASKKIGNLVVDRGINRGQSPQTPSQVRYTPRQRHTLARLAAASPPCRSKSTRPGRFVKRAA